MQPVASTPAIATPPAPAASSAPTPDESLAGTGVQSIIADAIRGTVAGYKQSTRMSGVQADTAAMIPFETVVTSTGLLKNATANVPGVNKATGLLHTIGGFAMLILTSNVSGTIKAPGETAVDLGNRVADLIDGRDTAQGWGIGWGIRSEGDAPLSDVGVALDNAGML